MQILYASTVGAEKISQLLHIQLLNLYEHLDYTSKQLKVIGW